MMKENRFFSLNPHGFHRNYYVDWGTKGYTKTVFCVHGLTQNGRIFDYLAKSLADENFRVICPDIVGRGKSDWLSTGQDYNLRQYMSDITVLMAKTGVKQLHWIGTSMGGILGILLASMPRSPITRLIINDVSPIIRPRQLRKLKKVIGVYKSFPGLKQGELYLRGVYRSTDRLSAEQWRHIVKHSFIKDEDGYYRLTYDPGILDFAKKFYFFGLNLWREWKRINCPVLILRGKKSEILPKKIANAMLKSSLKADLVEFDGIGHAPSLTSKEQIKIIIDWLAV